MWSMGKKAHANGTQNQAQLTYLGMAAHFVRGALGLSLDRQTSDVGMGYRLRDCTASGRWSAVAVLIIFML